jgi:hypothetical protein
MNQCRSIEQVAARKVHRIVLSGPWTTSRCGGYRSTSLLTNPTERRAITVSGAGLGRGTPIGGGHRPGGELYPYASTSVTDGGTVSKPS